MREVIPSLVVDLQQRFLRQVFRELQVPGIPHEKTDQHGLIPVDEVLKRLRDARLDQDHQFVVAHARSIKVKARQNPAAGRLQWRII
jgi:hypothetical protein